MKTNLEESDGLTIRQEKTDVEELDGLTISHLCYRKEMNLGHMMESGQRMEKRLADFGREAAADIAVEMLHRHLIQMYVEVPKDGKPHDICTVVAHAVLMAPNEYNEARRKKKEEEEEKNAD